MRFLFLSPPLTVCVCACGCVRLGRLHDLCNGLVVFTILRAMWGCHAAFSLIIAAVLMRSLSHATVCHVKMPFKKNKTKKKGKKQNKNPHSSNVRQLTVNGTLWSGNSGNSESAGTVNPR